MKRSPWQSNRPSLASLSSYESSSIRAYLPDDLEDPPLACSLEGLCIHALIQTGVSPVGLNSGEDMVVQHHKVLRELTLDQAKILKDPATGLWSWGIKTKYEPATGSGADKEISYSGLRDDDQMRSLRHDIVGLTLCQDPTDVKLRTVFFERIPSGYGDLSPDYYREYKGCRYFIEIGTSKANSPEGADRDYLKKLSKYTMALEEADHDKPCFLVVIIVGKDFVLSNFWLEPELVDCLTFHMALAQLMELKMESLNMPRLMAPLETHRDVMVEEIMRQLNSIPVDEGPSQSPMWITKEFITSLSTPADEEKVMAYFLKEVASAKDTLIEMRSRQEDKRKSDFIETLRTQQSRSVQKPIMAFPCVVVPRSDEFKYDISIPIICDERGALDSTLNLWEAAFEGLNADQRFPERWFLQQEEDMLETDPVKQKEIEDRNKEGRKHNHRCDVKGKLSKEDLEDLALDGLWGKKHQNNSAKAAKEEENKLPYNWDTPLQDICDAVEEAAWFDEYDYANPDRSGLALMRHCMELTDQKGEMLSVVDQWTRTKIYSWLELISDISLEIAISMKQNVSSGSVLLKKLGHYEVYLLLLPTKMTEHIFFSIMIPPQDGVEVLMELPFRRLHKMYGGGLYTKFCSFRADKLSNQATSLSTMLGLASYWSYHYELPNAEPESFVVNKVASQMLNFSLLVRLENKHQTEEAITVSRYMYMEVLKCNSLYPPDPFRLICKFSDCPRSRLELWVMHRLLFSFQTMVDRPVVKPVDLDLDNEVDEDPEEEVPHNDIWEGLINFVTGTQELRASRLVNLFYIGYTVDKDQVAQANTDYQILKKAVKREREFDLSEVYRSDGTWDDFTETPKEKQFSINVIKMGCELMCSELSKAHGREFKHVLLNKILLRLSRHMTHELATIKASANLEHVEWDKLDKADQVLRDRKGRLKVIEAIVKKIGLFEYNPFMKLEEVVVLIESTSRGVISDLFKKNQHGGLREIYVLTIESRIVALFIETCSRVLCEEFDCETMTHPKNKSEAIERHKAHVARTVHGKGLKFAELHCSADKKNWNNHLTARALSIPLLMLLPGVIHGPIQRILNMWTLRLLQVPRGALKLLVEGVKLRCPTYTEMAMEFDRPGSTGRSLFADSKSSFIVFNTGMMQGILHYNSSLLHVGFLKVTSKLIRTTMKHFHPNTICKVDQMCSSDDSATIMSIMFPMDEKEEECTTAVFLGEVICQALTTFSNYHCLMNSEKSTMGARHQVEFNSDFIMGNTVAVPSLKWALACFGVTESQSPIKRQYDFYARLSQASSSGLPSTNTTMLQIAQGLLYYRLMGSSTSSHFNTYSKLLKLYPDPTVGFFIIDHAYAPGVLGFGFMHWFLCKKTGITHLKMSNVVNGSLEFTPEGGLLESLVIRHGDSRRYLSMMETLTDGEGVAAAREKINENPLALYRPAVSRSDSLIKILAKALSPGTADSLSRGVPFMQVVGSTVYHLHTFSYTRLEASMPDGKKEVSSNKISLIAEIFRRIDAKNEPLIVPKQVAEALSHPNYRRYEEYITLLSSYKEAREIPVRPMRYKKSSLRFQHATSHIGVPLYDLVREKWAGVPGKNSIQLMEKSWEEYLVLMPWLRDTEEETLEASPFFDHVQLHSFVSASKKTSRTYSRVGPAIRSSYTLTQLDQLARRTYKEGVVLRLSQDQKQFYLAFRDRRSAMGLALEIPVEGARLEAFKETVNNYPVERQTLESIRDLNRREAVLTIIMAKAMGDRFSDQEITKAVEEMGGGLFVSYLQAQKKTTTKNKFGKVVVKWTGHGIIVLTAKDLVCHIKVQDNFATEMDVNSTRQLTRNHTQVLKCLAEHSIYPSTISTLVSYGYYLTSDGVSPCGPGIGIIEKTGNTMKPPDNLSLSYSVTVQQGRLALEQITENSKHVVLAYNTLSHEFSVASTNVLHDNVWDAWYQQGRLESSVAIDFINETGVRYKNELSKTDRSYTCTKEVVALRQFLKKTLLARLRHKGYSVGALDYGVESDSESEAESEVNSAVKMRLSDTVHCLKEPGEIMGLLRGWAAQQDQDTLQENRLAGDLAEGILCNPFPEGYSALLSKTARPVELSTDRLSSQYSVLPFWDELIKIVSNYNPSAWPSILSGRNVAGIEFSQSLIWLLLEAKSLPALILGRSKSEQELSEADIAVYAPTGSYRSRTSKDTAKMRLAIEAVFKKKARSILTSSEKFKSKPELVEEFLTMIEEPLAESLAIIETESKSSAGSLKGEEPDPTPEEKVSSWLASSGNTGPDTLPMASIMNVQTLLTSDEITWLHGILMSKLELIRPDAVVTTNHLKSGIAVSESPAIDEKEVLFCHMGTQESGHWVSCVTGMETNKWTPYIWVYDGLNSDSNRPEVLRQLRNIFPDLAEDQLVYKEVPQQEGTECGHVAFLHASHALMGWKVPEYSKASLTTWILNTLICKRLQKLPAGI